MQGNVLISAAALVLAGCGRGDDGPAAGATAGGDGPAWFVEHTHDAGLDFVHESGASGGLYEPEIMGAGVALLDYDNDGDLDLYFTNGNGNPATGEIGGGHVNRLYRHDPGGVLTDVTEVSGLGDPGFGMGVAVGDVNNDGLVDVYVTNFGPDRLYLNRGGGSGAPRFEDVTGAAGIDVPGWSCSAAFLDYDNDGDLDLYVTQYVVFDPDRTCFDHAGRPDYCGPEAFVPAPDVLLRNDGRRDTVRFTDVSGEAGIEAVACAGLGVVCEDFDGDRWPDIYVANDADPNQLWLNRKGRGFVDIATVMGVAYNMHGQTEAGMGVIAEDLDDDGLVDLFVTHLAAETNTLYRNRGPGAGFVDASGVSGLGASSMSFTGFGTCAFDLELDGDLDLAVVNGRVNLLEPLPGARADPPWNRLAEPNLLYLAGPPGRFRLANEEGGPLTAVPEISRALAMGDLDDDGDMDLVVANIEGPARVYLNDTPRQGRWLGARVIDPLLNRFAIGARVTVTAGGRTHERTVRRAFSYLASSDPRVHFGLGPADEVESVTVSWPDGLVERFDAGCVDCMLDLRRGEGEAVR